MKTILDWVKNLFNTKPDRFLGILGDGEDVNVIPFEEAVGLERAESTEVHFESDTSKWRIFIHQYQWTSGSCVAFTIAKIAQILFFNISNAKVKFSPGWIYKQRFNKPDAGMHYTDVVKLAAGGMITEELYPSERMSDSEMDSLPSVPYGMEVSEAFAISPNWVELPKDFNTVAKSIRKTEKGIMFWAQFGKGEFFNKLIPISNGSKQEYRHSFTATDAVKYKGVNYLLVEDSADDQEDTKLEGKDFEGRKLISEDWFNKHFILARYPLNFKFATTGTIKPKYDGSISSAQDCLEYEGLFPSNLPRGFMGPITIKAIQDFQIKYGIVYSGTPGTTGFGKIGPRTEALFYNLYS